MPHDVGERAGDLLRTDVHDVVVGAELLGDLVLVRALVVVRVLERDRERAQLVVEASFASAVVRLESSPPDRYVPTGRPRAGAARRSSA